MDGTVKFVVVDKAYKTQGSGKCYIWKIGAGGYKRLYDSRSGAELALLEYLKSPWGTELLKALSGPTMVPEDFFTAEYAGPLTEDGLDGEAGIVPIKEILTPVPVTAHLPVLSSPVPTLEDVGYAAAKKADYNAAKMGNGPAYEIYLYVTGKTQDTSRRVYPTIQEAKDNLEVYLDKNWDNAVFDATIEDFVILKINKPSSVVQAFVSGANSEVAEIIATIGAAHDKDLF